MDAMARYYKYYISIGKHLASELAKLTIIKHITTTSDYKTLSISSTQYMLNANMALEYLLRHRLLDIKSNSHYKSELLLLSAIANDKVV